MPSLAAAKAANAAATLSYTPVALFLGGTSGIGQATAQALARYTQGDAHIIISGRNQAVAEETIASFPKSDKSTYEFLLCDATLISNVNAACASLTSSISPRNASPLTKLNYLFLSSGYIDMGGRNNSVEGIDKGMAVAYYSRWKFVIELLPLLQAARDAGEDARVVTIMAAGNGSKVDLDNMGFAKKYSFRMVFSQVPTYMSLICEELARQNPEVSFTHAYPGAVDTPIITHWIWRLMKPLLKWKLISPADCAEWMIRPLLDPGFTHGAFHIGLHADAIPSEKLPLTDEAREKVYADLMETVGARGAGPATRSSI